MVIQLKFRIRSTSFLSFRNSGIAGVQPRLRGITRYTIANVGKIIEIVYLLGKKMEFSDFDAWQVGGDESQNGWAWCRGHLTMRMERKEQGRNLPKWHRFRPCSFKISQRLLRTLCISLASGLPQLRIHIRRGGEIADNLVGVDELGNRFLKLGSKSHLFVL